MVLGGASLLSFHPKKNCRRSVLDHLRVQKVSGHPRVKTHLLTLLLDNISAERRGEQAGDQNSDLEGIKTLTAPFLCLSSKLTESHKKPKLVGFFLLLCPELS